MSKGAGLREGTCLCKHRWVFKSFSTQKSSREGWGSLGKRARTRETPARVKTEFQVVSIYPHRSRPQGREESLQLLIARGSATAGCICHAFWPRLQDTVGGRCSLLWL